MQSTYKEELSRIDKVISKDPLLKKLNSKGHSIVKVKCAYCKKTFETIVPNVDKKRALKNDVFFCGSNCEEGFGYPLKKNKEQYMIWILQ